MNGVELAIAEAFYAHGIRIHEPQRAFVKALRVDPAHGRELPDGIQLARALKKQFRLQRADALRALSRYAPHAKGFVTKDITILPPAEWYQNPTLGWDHQMGEAIFPSLESYWNEGGERKVEELASIADRAGFSPLPWSVRPHRIQESIRNAAFTLSRNVNNTTKERMAEIVPQLKSEIERGLFKGDSYAEMTRRVNGIFREADERRSYMIAATEATRAIHRGEIDAAEQSGVVVGKEWLLSSDACPLCQTIKADNESRLVGLREAFAVVGNHPDYSFVDAPPAHPTCRCSMIEVLIGDERGRTRGTAPKLDEPTITEKPQSQTQTSEIAGSASPGKKPTSRKPRKPKEVDPIEAQFFERLNRQIDRQIELAKPTPDDGSRKPGSLTTLDDVFTKYTKADSFIAQVKENRNSLDAARAEYDASIREFQERQKAGIAEPDRKRFDEASKAYDAAIARYEQIKDLLPKASGKSQIVIEDFGDTVSPAVKKAIDGAKEFYSQYMDREPLSIGVTVKNGARAHYEIGKGTMVLSDSSVSTAIHEIAHAIEVKGKDTFRLANEFRLRRTGNEADTPMKKFGDQYKDTEQGRADGWLKLFDKEYMAYYTGKSEYTTCTEIVSMGIELMYNDPKRLALHDPEYFKLIHAILTGAIE